MDADTFDVLNDTNSIFTEDNPDEITVNVDENWPTCDLAVEATDLVALDHGEIVSDGPRSSSTVESWMQTTLGPTRSVHPS